MSWMANRIPFLARTVVASLGSACVAFAQRLEQVTAAAHGREQRVEDVGTPVTALSGKQIRELHLRNEEERP